MSVFGWLVMGLLAGWVAKALVPGRQPGGWIVTTVSGSSGPLSVAGSGRNSAGGQSPVLTCAALVSHSSAEWLS